MAESYELRGKYHKIDRVDDSARPSLEAASRSSSEDLDEFDPLNEDNGVRKSRTARLGSRDDDARRDNVTLFGVPSRTWRKRLMPGRMCCLVLLICVGALVLLLTAGGVWAWKVAPTTGESPAWYPAPMGGTVKEWEESYRKAADLVRQMTLVEKVNITTGTGWMSSMCVGNTGPVSRLGFPALCLQDSPLGVRFADNITAFPAGVTVGATWDKDLMYQRGRLHGLEAKAKGVHIVLGPTMGPLGRSPAGGRNWEGFGSDPVLQGIASALTIKGLQDAGVIATAKHWVGNEQEHFRQSFEWGTPNAISSTIDDRTLHEIYAWPFAESVRAGVASVMCSYNQVNNSYACQNSKLLNGVLKDELGFQGFVQSDWLAQRSGVASALAGLDMTLPGDGLRWMDGDSLWGGKLTQAILNGSVPMERVNDMVLRIVAAWYQLGQDDESEWSDEGPNFSSWTNDEIGRIHPGTDDNATAVVNKFVNAQVVGDQEGEKLHGDLARRVAAAGHVVVKNEDNVLPLDRDGWPSASDENTANLKYRVGIFGEDARVNPDGPNACNDRGCNKGTLAMAWGSGTAEFPYLVEPLAAIKKAFNQDTVFVTDWPQNKLPQDQREIVEDQDVCIVLVNADAGEGYIKADGIASDRPDLLLQKGGEDLVKDVAQNCGKGAGKTIVVIHSVGPVIMGNWIDLPGVKAVIMAHLPGQESGNALVDILFGDINPSGRLPYSIAQTFSDYGPGAKILTFLNGVVPQQNFTEGLYIDYRYIDAHDVAPRFEFGFGLSYTTFSLSDLSISKTPDGEMSPHQYLPAPRPTPLSPPSLPTTLPSPSEALFPADFRKLTKYIYPYLSSLSSIPTTPDPNSPPSFPPSSPSPAGGAQGGNPSLYTALLNATFTVRNTGSRPGHCVPQLYISYPPDYTDDETGQLVDFPVKVLRGFEKVGLREGMEKQVGMQVTRKDLSYWDVGRQNWVLPRGRFTVWVGWSSRDLPGEERVEF